ncbi:hypothetical protein SAMN00120144_4331 [Hymenobacter roseosalivarius DSM 11622]|uniref:Uncharacterized protein n=1 Tax=Hymenobacter roseosalivarius DSM 11622 TaxID=645990 RepID=A0A1W1UHD9_9BACT|nr:hypothetical protein [Hymenobacter roseosalivarius]SMB80487.1 hypothetical protein SAMN00120144_4331 [Hymenobacter roseosalivarius DSM 11622]
MNKYRINAVSLVKEYYKPAIVYTAWFGLVLFLMPRQSHFLDMPTFARWAVYSFECGLGNIYQLEEVNYLPFYPYLLHLYGQLAGSVAVIYSKIYWLKAITLLFDFIGAIVAVSFVQGTKKQFALSFWLLLNIAYLYNTLIWGQVDSIYTCFTFIAAALALRKQPIGSLVFYVLALNTKTQAIVFLPVLLLLWLPLWLQSARVLPLALLAAVGLQFVLLIPFIWLGEQNYLMTMLSNHTSTLFYFDVISWDSYNFWHLLAENHPATHRNDMLMVAGLTYRSWGLLLFCLSSAVVLLPLFILTVRNLFFRVQALRVEPSLVFLTCALVTICLCYFKTEMHSRYWHPAILFLAAYGFVSKRYALLFICSVAYTLNLEAAMQFLRKDLNIFLEWNPQFNSRFIASIYTLLLVLAVRELYSQFNFKEYLPRRV